MEILSYIEPVMRVAYWIACGAVGALLFKDYYGT